MAFDLLYLNGQSLVKKPLEERRSLLHSSFNELETKFLFAQYRDGDNAETMQEFLDESVKGKLHSFISKCINVFIQLPNIFVYVMKIYGYLFKYINTNIYTVQNRLSRILRFMCILDKWLGIKATFIWPNW